MRGACNFPTPAALPPARASSAGKDISSCRTCRRIWASRQTPTANRTGCAVIQPNVPKTAPSISTASSETQFLRSKMDIDEYYSRQFYGNTFSRRYEELDRQHRQLKQQEFYDKNGYSWLHQGLDQLF